MRSISALDTQLINLKRSGKEDVTLKPAIEGEHHKQFRARAVCSSVFFPTPALKKSLVPYCFFSFAEEAVKDRDGSVTATMHDVSV